MYNSLVDHYVLSPSLSLTYQPSILPSIHFLNIYYIYVKGKRNFANVMIKSELSCNLSSHIALKTLKDYMEENHLKF